MQFQFFSKNGQILPLEQAVIPIENIEYEYGFGVYETLKVRNGMLYFTEQHVKRLFISAEIIQLDHPFTQFQVIEFITEVIKKNGIDACNIKMLLIGGRTKDDALLFIIPLAPLYPDRKLYKQGAKTITVDYERIFPQAKTLNMLGSYLAYRKARQQNCYDALLLDRDGYIVEGTRTNFFAIKEKTLFTPPTEKVLQGVTKDTLFYVAKNNNYQIQEIDIPLAGINQYDGTFLTSTSTKIMPISQIDDMIQEIPEELRRLMKLYDEFLEESGGKFKSAEIS